MGHCRDIPFVLTRIKLFRLLTALNLKLRHLHKPQTLFVERSI